MINAPYWESENILAVQLSQWERKQAIFVEHTKLLDGNERLQALVLYFYQSCNWVIVITYISMQNTEWMLW